MSWFGSCSDRAVDSVGTMARAPKVLAIVLAGGEGKRLMPLTADRAKPGDTVKILGNRSLDTDEKRLKAVRVTVGSKTYDIYPDRIKKD